MRGVERGANRRAAVPPRSIRLERNPRTLTYSPGTMRRRRAPHSQRGGRRPRGDVSPTGRVFHTARSIKFGALWAFEPPSIAPDQEEFIRGCRGSPDAQPRSNTSIRSSRRRRRPRVDEPRARTRRPTARTASMASAAASAGCLAMASGAEGRLLRPLAPKFGTGRGLVRRLLGRLCPGPPTA